MESHAIKSKLGENELTLVDSRANRGNHNSPCANISAFSRNDRIPAQSHNSTNHVKNPPTLYLLEEARQQRLAKEQDLPHNEYDVVHVIAKVCQVPGL